MSILFSGDFHANVEHELSVISKKTLVRKHGKDKFSGIRYHIILGDGGFMWHDNQEPINIIIRR